METLMTPVDRRPCGEDIARTMSRISWRHHFALVVVLAGACAQTDAQFNVEYAPGFSRSGSAISVFGVFKDGRMSSDSWAELGPKLAASLANGPCEIAYSDDFVKTKPGLSSAVDDYARANGLTDDLLNHFAPVARGDLIMTFSVSGSTKPPDAGTSSEPSNATSSPPSRRGGGSRGRRRTQAAPSERRSAGERSALEVTATLFSVALHRSVAVVQMIYSGSDAEEGLRKFSERLAASLPGSTCIGWNWAAHIDEDEIRKMDEP